MKRLFFLGICCCWLLALSLSAASAADSEEVSVPSKEKVETTAKIDALKAILDIRKNLSETLQTHRKNLKNAVTDEEKANLLDKIAAVEKELADTDLNFEEIATDTDLAAIREQPDSSFSLEAEILALVKPTLQELNNLTRDVRKKSELREEIAKNQEKQQYIEDALEHLSTLLSNVDTDKKLKAELQKKIDYWEKEKALTTSQLTSSSQQLKKLVEAEVPLTESTRIYFREFFQQRGLYISQALLAITVIIILSQLIRKLLKKLVPQFNQRSRSFRIRLLDLMHRIITLALIIISPIIVFYLAEDWVLFSFSLLILIGVIWTLRTAIPEYRKQIELFLNIGPVREGERILYEGIPWRVEAINIFSILENPVAGTRLRLPIKDLIDLKSRPANSDEPWFPCTKGDWVLLSDGIRGKVIGISSEFIKLVQRGGAQKTYLTADFLGLSPLNLSVNFRIKEVIGVSYDLQAISTTKIPEILHETIMRRVAEEGYEKDLLNLRVEFALANTSSLDLVVIADFRGNLGDLYNRLRRAIQRWCVDACTENNWEIPFTQITVHNSEAIQT
ncbi:MAG: hypothetical protein R3F02_04150 [Thiolinea sp.]